MHASNKDIWPCLKMMDLDKKLLVSPSNSRETTSWEFSIFGQINLVVRKCPKRDSIESYGLLCHVLHLLLSCATTNNVCFSLMFEGQFHLTKHVFNVSVVGSKFKPLNIGRYLSSQHVITCYPSILAAWHGEITDLILFEQTFRM